MTDPLGQSQVIPYLKGLVEKGHEIFLISCEKKSGDTVEYKNILSLLRNNNIKWFPLKYTSKPLVLSTMNDLRKIKKKAREIIETNAIEIVHCRSYIAALAGLSMKKKYSVKFVFDMRGFWADERVDGMIWNLRNPVFKSVYSYFKRKEKEFFVNADYTISLTENAKKIILDWQLTPKPLKIQVIPCCADLDFFNTERINEEDKTKWMERLKISNSDFVLSYLGSLGTWYMPNEMLDFFKVLLQKQSNSKFLFITPDLPEMIIQMAEKKGIPAEKIIVQKASRNEVPVLIAMSQISIFFIKPVFSKRASSPTKMGEIMGMGVPVICNSNVGDVDEIIEGSNGGYIIDSFDDPSYEKAIQSMNGLINIKPVEIRKSAEKYFSLQAGVNKYDMVYQSLGKL